MGFNDVNQALASRGLPASKFETIGDEHVGVLKDADIQDVTDPNGNVQFQKDGVTPKKQLVLTWQTEERDAENASDIGMRKLYCSWRLERSIRDAFREAGAQGLEPEARLAVKFVKEEKVPGAGMKAKLYEVTYVRPTLASSSDSGEYDETSEPDADFNPKDVETAVALAKAKQPNSVISQVTGLPADYLETEEFKALVAA